MSKEHSDARDEANAGVVIAKDGTTAAVPASVQTAINAVVAWAHGGRSAKAPLRRVCEYVEKERLGLHNPSEHMIEATSPTDLPTMSDLRREVDDEEVRAHCGLDEGDRVLDAHRMRYYGELKLGNRQDSDDVRLLFPLEIAARDGRRAVVPRTWYGAMMSTDVRFEEWSHPCRTWGEFHKELRAARWILSVEDWLELSPRSQRKYFRRW